MTPLNPDYNGQELNEVQFKQNDALWWHYLMIVVVIVGLMWVFSCFPWSAYAWAVNDWKQLQQPQQEQVQRGLKW